MSEEKDRLWQCDYCQEITDEYGNVVYSARMISHAEINDELESWTCGECANRIQLGDF